MKFKPKRWHKIVLISIAGVSATLILFNILLTNYIRKSIEETYSSLLKSDVSIRKLKINYFSGTIKLYDILITGKRDFKSDTLLSADKFILSISEFDKKNNRIIIEELRVANLRINNIVSQSGENCWDIEKNQDIQDDEDILNDLKIFVKTIVLENSELFILNRQDLKTQSYTNVNLKIYSVREDDNIISEFSADCIINTGYFEKRKFSLSGKSKYNDNKIEAGATLRYGDFPIQLKIGIITDSLSEEMSYINLNADFSKLPKNKNVETKGDLEISISSKGIFKSDYDFNFSLDLIADSISIINFKNNSRIIANFNTKIGYKSSKQEIFSFISEDIFLYSGIEPVRGYIDFKATDSATYAKSNIIGSFNSDVLNLIYENNTFLTEIKINTSSDLEGEINKYSKALSGEYISDIVISNPDFNILELNIGFIKNSFSVKSKIVSQMLSGKFNYSIEEIENLYNDATLKHNFIIDFSKLSIPVSGGIESPYIPKIDKSEKFRFPHKTELSLTIDIDSITIKDKALTNLHSEIKLLPNSFGIYNLNLEIGDGLLTGELSLKQDSKYQVLQNSLCLRNLDLSYFADSAMNISGKLNIDLENTIYSSETDENIPKNNGINLIRFEDFELKTSLLKQYEIDEDALILGNTEIITILDGDNLQIKPTLLTINDANINLKANYNLITDSISVNVLLDIPNTYLSSKIKILISMFASDSEFKLQKKENRNIYLIRIIGYLSDPEYIIYE